MNRNGRGGPSAVAVVARCDEAVGQQPISRPPVQEWCCRFDRFLDVGQAGNADGKHQ